MGTFKSYVEIRNNVNVTDQFKHMAQEDLERIINDLEADKRKTVKVSEVLNKFHINRHWIHRSPHHLILISDTRRTHSPRNLPCSFLWMETIKL